MKMRELVYQFARERGVEPPVNLVDFANWLESKYPEASERLEKHAAFVLTRAFASDFEDSQIPNLEDRPIGAQVFLGDVAKIGGVTHIWDGSEWVTLEGAGRF
jgi:hypothetical protein